MTSLCFNTTATSMTTQRWKANHRVSLLPKSLHRHLLRPTFLLVHRAIHWTTWYRYSEEVEEGRQCRPQPILGLVLLEGQGWVLDLVGCLCRLCLHGTQLRRQSRLHNSSLRTICWGCSRRFYVSYRLSIMFSVCGFSLFFSSRHSLLKLPIRVLVLSITATWSLTSIVHCISI